MPAIVNATQPTPYRDFTDLEGFVALARTTSLAVSPDGKRVVVAVQQPDTDGAKYVSALWEVDPNGQVAPRRLTFSRRGESAPRFAADGSLLFASARPDPEGTDSDADGNTAIWRLPEHGEARVVADLPGGLALAGLADDGTLLATTNVVAGGSLDTDEDARTRRKDRGVTAILHTGMPIRSWDHEVGDTSPRLVLVGPRDPDGGQREPDPDIRDLTPGADTVALLGAEADLAPGGRTVVTTWRSRVAGGETAESVVLLDVSSRRPKRRTLLRGTRLSGYGRPAFSPDGSRLAALRTTASSPTDTSYDFLEVHPVERPGQAATADVGDLTVTEYRWAPDGATLYVAGDLHSRGAILAVDPTTGQVRRTLADDAAYGSLQLSANGRHLYALRSTVDAPPHPVRFRLGRNVRSTRLRAPGTIGDLPGRMERVSTDVDGVEVGGWLCTPNGASAKRPVPLMVWVHGGPHVSYNAWSWRWCPWLYVAHGYAVLLPDPAMSTGYGHAGLNRGWPRLPDVVWREVERLADHVLRRTTLDGARTALLGASFGGFMTNWIAGHTTRFRAIVTHAGLYALDQQHATTDAAAGKTRVHRTPAELPEWFARYSPHHHVSRIATPMLVTHGNKDYRVPVSEALRLWWDLVSGWKGRPADLPHRFLQLTGENHWVLSPANARVWNATVLAFCDAHVRGRGQVPDGIPEW